MRLENGSEIAIIGGGPAGSFFARFASQYASKYNLDIKITIYSNRDFTMPGPRGCKGCVGVVNERLHKKLKQHGFFLPEHKTMQEIDSYCLVTRTGSIFLKKKTEMDRIVTMYRGNGPMFSSFENISFDDFLLNSVKGKYVSVIDENVNDVKLPGDGEKAEIFFGNEKKSHKVDLIVGAFGVNSRIIDKFKGTSVYQPPETTRACTIEIPCSHRHMVEKVGNTIYIFTLALPEIEYGIIIPKREFLTVSVIGKKDIKNAQVQEFLKHPSVAAILPDLGNGRYCRCCTSIPTITAKDPFSDRLVIIGDAGYSRYYKNGLESAFNSAKVAARTVFEHGVSKEDFRNYYYPECKKMFVIDNYYGRILFTINRIISSYDFLSMAHADIAMKEQKRENQPLNELLWNMFTGHERYKKIFLSLFNWKMQQELLIETGKEIIERLTKRCRIK